MGMFTVHAAYGDRNIGKQPDVAPSARIGGMAELVALIEDLQQESDRPIKTQARTAHAIEPVEDKAFYSALWD